MSKTKTKTPKAAYNWDRLKRGKARIVTTFSAVVAAYQYAQRQRAENDSKAPVFKSEKLKTGNWRVTRTI
jgi:hypothetical protein